MEMVKLIETAFSTADAEFPNIFQEDGDLLVVFRDWKENEVRLHFADHVAFKWQMAFELNEGERDDCCYQVLESSWLAKHIACEIISETEGYKHYRLNFNENGQLDVISFNLVQIK